MMTTVSLSKQHQKGGGETAVRECRENGGRAVFQRTDVTAEADIRAAIERAVSEFGKLDVMYNNAGLAGATGSIEHTSVEDWDRTQAVLLRVVDGGLMAGPVPFR